MVVEIENFFGCYLLLNLNPEFKGRTYIGFTVDPRRRITQHNKGSKYGGAKRTSGRGPWEMVLIVYGFPNKPSALMFEWAWQHPRLCKRLKHVPAKRKTEKRFLFDLRVLSNMLKVGPWCRLPLTVQWLKQEHMREFEDGLQPPVHMPIAFGPVTSIKMHSKQKKKLGTKSTQDEGGSSEGTQEEEEMVEMTQAAKKRCAVCLKRLQAESTLSCVHPTCSMEAHILCLAGKFLRHAGGDYLLPVDGNCPVCKQNVLWGDLIRKMRGCYSNLSTSEDGHGRSLGRGIATLSTLMCDVSPQNIVMFFGGHQMMVVTSRTAIITLIFNLRFFCLV
ncbi:structure-specific endonuclease subunit slx1-like [Acanthaster planci]|uniref:Structure-specific endonuclease subunit SLX1 homolog n=1 Tax=Acanthaster planci TaxID=133434 RepID=A0A8B7ZWM1_ACAPL|nr:structure-specific endonuclease subunit slx1-like [Acanthaster planci]